MGPHMSAGEGTIFLILLAAPLAFGLCGALSIVPLLFRGRVGRIAQRLAATGLIFVHATILLAASEYWVDIMFLRARDFLWLTPIAHALVLAGYVRVRSRQAHARQGSRESASQKAI